MNRFYRDSLAAPAASSTGGGGSSQPRRGRPVAGADRDENLELFARTRHSIPPVSPSGSDVMAKLGRLSIGSTKPIPIKSPADDLVSSTDGGKHDYDWLLTPPETPLFSSDTSDVQIPIAPPRSSTSIRSVSVSKTSKLSATHPENGNPARPARSNSVTRPSISNTYSNYTSNTNRTAILNTSTASIASSRPATPPSRSTSARVSVPAARPLPVRSSTPAKTRPLSASSIDKPRPSQNPRPSTPTSRPQLQTSANSALNRAASRPSTPTRKKPAPSAPPSTIAAPRSSSVGRVPPGRVAAPSSRHSSPSPRARIPPQPIVPPDFPLDAPPNLRTTTTLPDRPVSAGRSRPGTALIVRGNSEPAVVNPPRRQPSPVASRGRLPELSRKNHVHSNAPEAAGVSRPARPTSTSDSTGFGRTISKKSLDMALRHMDIRQSVGSTRSINGNSLYPHSIRGNNLKGRSGPVSNSPSSVGSNGSDHSNGNVAKSPDFYPQSNGDHNGGIIAKLSLDPDIYESSRYESILLKEDLKNTNWLHSVEDKSDESPAFDHRFETLPEPFCLI